MSGAVRWALVHGGDDALPALLTDVLSELGLEPCPEGTLHAELVLVHVDGPSGLAHLERAAQCARARAASGGPGAVVAVLPFADEGMGRAARERGACGVYALGTPLSHLRALVSASIPAPKASPARPGGAPPAASEGGAG